MMLGLAMNLTSDTFANDLTITPRCPDCPLLAAFGLALLYSMDMVSCNYNPAASQHGWKPK